MSVDRHRPNLVFRGFFDSSTFHHRLATSRSVVRVLPTRFHVLEGWFGPEGGQGMHGRAPNRRPFGGVVVETADKQHLLSPCNERTHVLDLMEGGWGVVEGRGGSWDTVGGEESGVLGGDIEGGGQVWASMSRTSASGLWHTPRPCQPRPHCQSRPPVLVQVVRRQHGQHPTPGASPPLGRDHPAIGQRWWLDEGFTLYMSTLPMQSCIGGACERPASRKCCR